MQFSVVKAYLILYINIAILYIYFLSTNKTKVPLFITENFIIFISFIKVSTYLTKLLFPKNIEAYNYSLLNLGLLSKQLQGTYVNNYKSLYISINYVLQ